MKTEYCLKKRDKLLLTVVKVFSYLYFTFSITYLFMVEPILGIKSHYSGIFLAVMGFAVAWSYVCEYNKNCREASLMLLSAIFFICGILLKLPAFLLVKGIAGTGELIVSRTRRFLKNELRRFKKHP